MRVVFLLSAKAGGVGLNLQEASHVILYDLWWNRSAETQAICRVFRIGQKSLTVYVDRFITDIALENSIYDYINEKERKINLIWKAIDNCFNNLSFEEKNEIYSFIHILQFDSSEINHVSKADLLANRKKYKKLLALSDKKKKQKEQDDLQQQLLLELHEHLNSTI